MTETVLACHQIEAKPFSLILPSECVADVVESPSVITDPTQKAAWMAGYVEWNAQEIPLLCFESLLDETFAHPENAPIVTILEPIPKAVRKTYGAILSFGLVDQVELSSAVEDAEFPQAIDRRYVQAALTAGSQTLLVPKLVALGVAFSYY